MEQHTTSQQSGNWQQALREAFTEPRALLHYLELDPDLPLLAARDLRHFRLRVPRGFAARMNKADPNDPLFLQVWPAPAEATPQAGFELDAVGDSLAARTPNLLHKYHGRALLITTGACAVHCRYCFRRHFDYHESTDKRWTQALEMVARDATISELILSGGDPLSLSNQRLAALFGAAARIPHLVRIRIHTRQAVVLPERIDTELLGLLEALPMQKVCVIHANHAREIDANVSQALQAIARAGTTLLNQSVLLRRINDSAQALVSLSERLFSCGVLPYYVHQLDRVQGSAHFEVPDDQARKIMEEVSAQLPGYLVPRLAREIAGEPGKTLISW